MKLTTIRTFTFAALFTVGSLTIASAQQTAPSAESETAATAEANNTLQKQFRTMRDRSNTYQDFRVIKQTTLDAFWRQVQDSLTANHKELVQAQQEINTQKAELNSLNQELAKREEKLQKSDFENSRITVLGISLPKDTYVNINWGIFFVLLAACGIALFQYKRSNKVAVDKQKEFEILNQEFNAFKQRVREKELRVGRELQTERNRVEELNQRIAHLERKVHP
jgi:hypothetical protein